MFRFFTRQTIVPNNFLLVPGALVPAIQSSPLTAVHFAYAILKLRPAPTFQQRREIGAARYGGKSSQNLFMLVSHGLVGLMLFYEVVVAKIFMLLSSLQAHFRHSSSSWRWGCRRIGSPPRRILICAAIAAGIVVVGLFGLLGSSAALALMFKLTTFTCWRRRPPDKHSSSDTPKGPASLSHKVPLQAKRVGRGAS